MALRDILEAAESLPARAYGYNRMDSPRALVVGGFSICRKSRDRTAFLTSRRDRGIVWRAPQLSHISYINGVKTVKEVRTMSNAIKRLNRSCIEGRSCVSDSGVQTIITIAAHSLIKCQTLQLMLTAILLILSACSFIIVLVCDCGSSDTGSMSVRLFAAAVWSASATS